MNSDTPPRSEGTTLAVKAEENKKLTIPQKES